MDCICECCAGFPVLLYSVSCAATISLWVVMIYRFKTNQVPETDVLILDKQIRQYLAKHQLSESECESIGICGEERWRPQNF